MTYTSHQVLFQVEFADTGPACLDALKNLLPNRQYGGNPLNYLSLSTHLNALRNDLRTTMVSAEDDNVMLRHFGYKYTRSIGGFSGIKREEIEGRK